jgi:small subunit ribosomal protein S9
VKIYRDDARGGEYSINGKSLEEAFPWFTWQGTIELVVTGMKSKFYVEAKLAGGGVSSQSEALRHGIARALLAYDENFKKPLKGYGLLTRDSRIKESKKYGLKRARRAPQYTKR